MAEVSERVRKCWPRSAAITAVQFNADGDRTKPVRGMTLWRDSGEAVPRDMTWGYVLNWRGIKEHVYHGDWVVGDGPHYRVFRPDDFAANYEVPETPLTSERIKRIVDNLRHSALTSRKRVEAFDDYALMMEAAAAALESLGMVDERVQRGIGKPPELSDERCDDIGDAADFRDAMLAWEDAERRADIAVKSGKKISQEFLADVRKGERAIVRAVSAHLIWEPMQ